MRVTAIDLYTPDGAEPISFSLRDLDPTAQYNIRTIVGLDAEDLVPKFYGFGLNTQVRFYEFVLKPRDIVARIILTPRTRLDESFSDVRDQLYRAISSTRFGQISLNFRAGGTTVAKIVGLITKFEGAYFQQLPEVQLTINCSDPMFRAINPVTRVTEELPTTNPVTIADSLSTAPHGFTMQFVFTEDTPSFTIQDVETDPEWKFKITPALGFQTDDILYISSEYTNKTAYIIRDGDVIFLLDNIEPTSIWPILFPGGNSFHFVDLDSVTWESMEFYAAYWGV